MDKWQKVLDIINEVQGTTIEMNEEFDIENFHQNPYKFVSIDVIGENTGLINNKGSMSNTLIGFLIRKDEKIIQKPKKWKPKMKEEYFTPFLHPEVLYSSYEWDNHYVEMWRLNNNLVCKTKIEAIAKAKKMLKAIESEGE